MIVKKPNPAVVLIVDDDEAARLMMSVTLEEAGFVVVTAENCANARAVFAEKTLDVILLDVLLPDGDGYDLCREFLATPKGKDLPVAMVTGLDDLESIRLGYQNGATDFITKPVSWGTLPYRIEYLLQASRNLVDLSVSESKMRALLSSIPDIIIRIRRDGSLLDMQVGSHVHDMAAWVEYEPDSSQGKLPATVMAEISDALKLALDGHGMQLIEFQWSDDASRICHWETRLIKRDDNEALMVVRDITQRKQQEVQMRLWSKVFEGSNEAILITDANFKIISVNKAYERIMGFTEVEVLDKDASVIGSRLHTYSFFRNMISLLNEKGHWQGELTNQRKDNETFPCWYSISMLSNSRGEPENYIAIFSDITEYKNSREKIEFLAHHDSLTGLPNRILLNDRLEMAINTAKRQGDKLSVLFIDLDRFKNVNDSLGHAVGDQILKEAAARLISVVRNEDTVSRLGGDEFVILFPKLKREANIAEISIKIGEILQQPYFISGISLHITPSVGIAIYPDDGEDVNTLIKNADAAMYLAKEKGRNNFQFYTPALNARTLDRLKLESDLRLAMEQGNFELHYQPQIKLDDGKIWGMEALVRWRHPVRGLIPPNDFIPLAEETGLIIPLGEWVMGEALRQQKMWQQQGFTGLVMSINISMLQFRQVDFLARVEKLVEKTDSSPQLIELELTESMLMNDMESSIDTLKKFRDLGYRIAIDDFGTGFSSLNYLRRLPIDVLKIDQSFVRDMLIDSASLAIVESIIGLANALGKETVAEGVETKEEYDLLCERNCRVVQGYYIAKPMPGNIFKEWMESIYKKTRD